MCARLTPPIAAWYRITSSTVPCLRCSLEEAPRRSSKTTGTAPMRPTAARSIIAADFSLRSRPTRRGRRSPPWPPGRNITATTTLNIREPAPFGPWPPATPASCTSNFWVTSSNPVDEKFTTHFRHGRYDCHHRRGAVPVFSASESDGVRPALSDGLPVTGNAITEPVTRPNLTRTG